LGAFQERDIGPATLGETVENGGAYATAADDHGASMSLHENIPSNLISSTVQRVRQAVILLKIVEGHNLRLCTDSAP
jgi:hypothetical protein